MLRLLGRWLLRIAFALAIAFAATYLGDWAVFKLRGSPTAKVTVHQYASVPLKANKQEFDDIGITDLPCSISLFGQNGQSPCWQLRRHTIQIIQM
ncbi:MAG TPA: hypothetical protein VKR52_20685 [Terracidiphilus sp.]|nr:hypothetical protein [Terracidiphilus sp.]